MGLSGGQGTAKYEVGLSATLTGPTACAFWGAAPVRKVIVAAAAMVVVVLVKKPRRVDGAAIEEEESDRC